MASQSLVLLILIVAWYGSSIVCTNSTKYVMQLNELGKPSGLQLTVCQMFVSSLCGFFVTTAERLLSSKPTSCFAPSKAYYFLFSLAVVFTLGFVTLNFALGLMSGSLTSTLRATEPFVSLLLNFVLFGENPAKELKLNTCVAVIVVGACLASYGNRDFTWIGFGSVMLANVFFCFRTILYKKLKSIYPLSDTTLFFNLCWCSFVLNVIYMGIIERNNSEAWLLKLTSCSKNAKFYMLGNGISFYMYLQLSFTVLSRVSAISHSVLNSFRRPAVILFSILQFGNNLTRINGIGVAMACIGVSIYSILKRSSQIKHKLK